MELNMAVAARCCKLLPVQATEVELELRVLHGQRLGRAVVIEQAPESWMFLKATHQVARKQPLERSAEHRKPQPRFSHRDESIAAPGEQPQEGERGSTRRWLGVV